MLQNRFINFRIKEALFVLGIIFGSFLFVNNSSAGSVPCNHNAYSIDQAICLQDMNYYVKQSMSIGTEYTLVDSRDDKSYRVARLDDGNVWLLDNLSLGDTEEMTLTSDDTNTDPNLNDGTFILPASGDWVDSYTEPAIDMSEADTVIGTSEQRLIGGYYNYCAASAGTYCDPQNDAENDAEFDICPAGWRMPTGGNGGEYQVINNLYNNLQMILHLPLSGRYYNDASGHIEEDGYFWSSTNRDGARMYYLSRSSSSINSTGSYRRDRGYSMRCVAKDIKPTVTCNANAESIEGAVCISDVNARVAESMARGQAYALIDTRNDEVYNIAKLADGHVWFLDNLRLGSDQELLLTHDDTNTNPELDNGEFILPAADYWDNSFTGPMVALDNTNGGYYNYCAASAGTICEPEDEGTDDAQYDICPADWRLPTGGDGGEYQTLSESSDIISDLRLPLSGRFYSGSLGRVGDDGYFWSSTNRDGARMYYLNINGDGAVSPTGSYRRDRGYSVRCLLDIKQSGTGEYSWRDGIDTHELTDNADLILDVDLSSKSLLSVSVNGETLQSDQYEVSPDNSIVLKAGYLNNLAAGSYSLVVTYMNDSVIETQFTVKESSPASDDSEQDITPVPNTGRSTKQDGSCIIEIIGFAACGIVIATVLLPLFFSNWKYRFNR